jgi:hypothetical protein
MAVDTKILEKIKKLLALSGSSNEHEAASALAMAQRMMEEHQVTIAAIHMSDVGEASVTSRTSISKPKDWETALFNVVASAFGCRLAWIDGRGSSNGSYTLVGLKDRVVLAEYASSVLGKKLVQARGDYVNELGGYGRAEKSEMANGFCKGWVVSIKKQVVALALGDKERLLIESYMDNKFNGEAKDIKKTKFDRDSMAAGMEAGAKESLHRPMSGKAQGNEMIGN